MPKPRGLVDTGALIALLDRRDRWHERCAAAFAKLQLPLATTTAVLAELFHLMRERPAEVNAAWRLFRSGALTLAPVSDDDLPSIEALMQRYADRPMDFADATLVHVAERESLTTVFTVDNDDFQTYRVGAKGRFRIVPGR